MKVMSTTLPRSPFRLSTLPVESLRTRAGAGFGGFATAPSYVLDLPFPTASGCLFASDEDEPPQPAATTAVARSATRGGRSRLSIALRLRETAYRPRHYL